MSDTGQRNVLGDELQVCGTDPMTGFFRDGYTTTSPADHGSHTVCAVVTAEFLAHQQAIGNDLSLDPGIGNCGKQGQWVPVGVGLPTVMIGGLTVGGSAV